MPSYCLGVGGGILCAWGARCSPTGGGGAGCSRGIRGSCGKVASEKNMQVLVATFVKSLRKKAEESTSGAPGWLNRVSIQLWLRS